MTRYIKGFGLVEIMLALVLGVVMTLALAQVFISSKNTWLSQTSSASVQEDARFVLSKMAQDIRLVGLSGCLADVTDASNGGRFSSAIETPVQWNRDRRSLTLVSGAVGERSGWHTWEIHTDCTTSGTAWSRNSAPRLKPGEFRLPIHELVYRLNIDRGELSLNGQPLLSHVQAFSVLFGEARNHSETGIVRYTDQPDPALVRSVRLTLTLIDPQNRTRAQTFTKVAAIRNRLG